MTRVCSPGWIPDWIVQALSRASFSVLSYDGNFPNYRWRGHNIHSTTDVELHSGSPEMSSQELEYLDMWGRGYLGDGASTLGRYVRPVGKTHVKLKTLLHRPWPRSSAPGGGGIA